MHCMYLLYASQREDCVLKKLKYFRKVSEWQNAKGMLCQSCCFQVLTVAVLHLNFQVLTFTLFCNLLAPGRAYLDMCHKHSLNVSKSGRWMA